MTALHAIALLIIFAVFGILACGAFCSLDDTIDSDEEDAR